MSQLGEQVLKHAGMEGQSTRILFAMRADPVGPDQQPGRSVVEGQLTGQAVGDHAVGGKGQMEAVLFSMPDRNNCGVLVDVQGWGAVRVDRQSAIAARSQQPDVVEAILPKNPTSEAIAGCRSSSRGGSYP